MTGTREANDAQIDFVVGLPGAVAELFLNGITGNVEITANGAFLVNGSPVGSGVAFKGAWSNVTAYSVGDIVTSGGVAYIAIQAGTNHTPASSPTFWTPVVAGGALVPTGGTTGQVLTKASNTDGDTTWTDKLAAIAAGTILANLTAFTAAPTPTSLAALEAAMGLAAIALSGSGADLAAQTVANGKLAAMAAGTVKANLTGGSASPSDVTLAALDAALAVFTSSLQGVVPASGGGTANFLRADGTWALPPGLSAIADQRIIGNVSGSSAVPIALTQAQVRTFLALAAIAMSGSGADLVSNSVANGALAQVATSTVKGRLTAGTGNTGDVTLSALLTALAAIGAIIGNVANQPTTFTVEAQGDDGVSSVLFTNASGGSIEIAATGALNLNGTLFVQIAAPGYVDISSPGGEVYIQDDPADFLSFFGADGTAQAEVNGPGVVLLQVQQQLNALLHALGPSGYGLIDSDQ